MAKFSLTRRHFLKLTTRTILVGFLSGIAGFEYSFAIEPNWIKVENLGLTLPNLPKTFHGIRLVQISDIHFDDWMTTAKFGEIVDRVNALQADILAITGDFVTGDQKHREKEIVKQLSRLDAGQARVAVLGNHDHWTDPNFIHHLIAQSSISDLTNEIFTLEKDGQHLHLCGVDDYWERQDRLDLVLNKLPAEGSAVLLVHEPDYADISAPTARFDLQLSGHSHGGQVILPFFGPPIVPRYSNKYPVGLYQVGGMLLYTNRGLGMIQPRLRFNCRPEITVFTLLAPS